MENSVPEKDPKISIVVPVYKVEKYLRECVESVLAQTFTDFELILVDDGSPDRCGEICDELAKKDPRIRVFHQENGGVVSARRLGVEQARGEWITFVDSDDLLPKDAIKNLSDEADADTDWVQGMNNGFADGKTPKAETRTGTVTSFDLAGLLENMLLRHVFPWGKLVRKGLFTPNVLDIPRELRIGEGTLMNFRLIVNEPRKPKEVDRVVYFYRNQENSVCRTCVRTENYSFRYIKLLLAEVRKVSNPSNKERLSYVLSRYLYSCSGVVAQIAYGLPIKFPHRFATLIRRGVKSNPRGFFIYLCLKFNAVGVAQFAARVFCLIMRINADVKSKTLLD